MASPTLPPWPRAADPMWTRAAQVVNALEALSPERAIIVPALANGYMESRFEPWVVGDKDTAFNIWQWHWKPRGALILKNTGIDVRGERSILKVCEALWWELNSKPYASVLAGIIAAPTVNQASQMFSLKYEGAGARDAAERRGMAGDYLAAWVANNRDFINRHPAT